MPGQGPAWRLEEAHLGKLPGAAIDDFLAAADTAKIVVFDQPTVRASFLVLAARGKLVFAAIAIVGVGTVFGIGQHVDLLHVPHTKGSATSLVAGVAKSKLAPGRASLRIEDHLKNALPIGRGKRKGKAVYGRTVHVL